MECMTVLQKPERSATEHLPPTYDSLVVEKFSGGSRLCSHRNQTILHVAYLVLFTVLFVSQLFLHVQLLQREKEIAHLQTQVQDLLTAQEIDQINYNSEIKLKHGISVGEHVQENKKKSSTRVRRNHQCHIPHFYLKGHDEQGLHNHYISETGVFFWKNRHVNRGAFWIIQNHSAGTEYLDGLQIQQNGTYYLFAQVHVSGRTDFRAADLSVGIFLKRDWTRRYQRTTDVLTKAFITQENMGRHYIRHGISHQRRYPVDVLHIDGLFLLTEGDIIYISRPDDQEYNHHILYNNREGFAHFGGYMVEPTGPCIT